MLFSPDACAAHKKILFVTWTWFRSLARRSRARDWSQLHRIYAVGSGWSEGRFAHARVARIARGIFSHRALEELMTSDLAHSLKRNEVFTASCSLRKTTALPDLDFNVTTEFLLSVVTLVVTFVVINFRFVPSTFLQISGPYVHQSRGNDILATR